MYFSDYYFRAEDELRDEDLLTVERCGCCGAKDSFRVLETFREEPKISMVRCRRCGAVTYDRILTQEKMDEIYENYNYLGADAKKASKDKVTFYGKSRFAKHVHSLISRHAYFGGQKKLRVLDFGGGDGALSLALCELIQKEDPCESIEIVVVDYADEPCKPEDPRISIRHTFPLESLPAEPSFDIVIASAVLEHLREPGKSFHRLVKMCAPGGVLYFRTPFKYPLYHLLKKAGSTLDMLYPRHLWDLGDEWWEKIARCAKVDGLVDLVESRPSIAEKSFKEHLFIALIANGMKAPWFACRKWKFVGGWETLYLRHPLS